MFPFNRQRTQTGPEKAPRRRLAPLWAAAVVTVALAACGGGDADDAGPQWVSVDASGNTTVDTSQLQTALAAYAVQTVDSVEAEDLAYMREEEQLAHDVYSASGLRYALPIFTNIANSELTHTAAVQLLLERYSVADPLEGLPEGTFATAQLQTLHDQLVAASSVSLVAALQVGAQIEELDIVDIQVRRDRTDNADIQLVYDNLMKGSRNHLRSFIKTLTTQGGTYTPQYLSQAEFDDIVNSDIERGN